MKNPQPSIKQVNIAHVHQQVNNGEAAIASAVQRAEKNESAPNELLKVRKNGIDMDTRASRKASCADTPGKTVGAKYRSQV